MFDLFIMIQLQNTKRMIATMDQEQEMFVTTFADERSRREEEEENLRRRLKVRLLIHKIETLLPSLLNLQNNTVKNLVPEMKCPTLSGMDGDIYIF